MLNASNITFNNSAPQEGDNITINATIFNIGGVSASNILVRFYDGNPSNGGTQIDADRTISLINAPGNFTVNATWIASLGQHEIFISVDPLNSITELSEQNNNASKNILIPIWSTIVGNVTGNLLLENLANLTIYSWYLNASFNGNLFAVDSDSIITWTNLTALGRNITGGNASNDWQELDNALNTTNYTDSINRTYTKDSVPLNMSSYAIFSSIIDNVSNANSTNSSNFLTGILWDMSDDIGTGPGVGQFNASEDVIFVTQMVGNTIGKYGNYDFEMRIPMQLKKYKEPDFSTVTFYVELK